MMKRRNGCLKAIVGGIVLLLIPVIGATAFSAVDPQGEISELTLRQPLLQAHSLAKKVQLVLVEEMRRTAVLTDDRAIRDAAALAGTPSGEAAAATNRLLAWTVAEAKNRYEALAVLDRQGHMVAGQGSLSSGFDASSPAFQAARSGRIGLGHPRRSERTGEVVVQICAPLLDQEGAFAGVLSGMIKMGGLLDRIGAVRAGESGYAFLVDGAGRIVANPRSGLLRPPADDLQRLVAAMDRQKTGSTFYTDRGEQRYAAFAPVPAAGWSIGFTQSRAALAAASGSRNRLGITLGAIALLLSLFALMGPVQRLLSHLSAGTGGHPAPTPSRSA